MPIRDIPFTCPDGEICRPILAIRLVNPASAKGLVTYGLVDTGADECAVPASFAPLLGYDLKSGKQKEIMTGNGLTIAYSHPVKIEIYHPQTAELLYHVPDSEIDFLSGLGIVLLGVHSFLNRFILHIDYPQQVFSIRYPSK